MDPTTAKPDSSTTILMSLSRSADVLNRAAAEPGRDGPSEGRSVERSGALASTPQCRIGLHEIGLEALAILRTSQLG